MNKVKEYNDILAFHPGYYVSEIIEDMEMTQKEFAKRLDTTEKTLSKLVNCEIRLSNEIANKLSLMTGISMETWLNLQSTYDVKCQEIESQQKLDEEIATVNLIDYYYFYPLSARRPPLLKWGMNCVPAIDNLKIMWYTIQ
jgi:addiction module HigA family antidote